MTSIVAALNYFDALRANILDAQDRIADLTDTCDILRTQNGHLQRELDTARGQRDDASAQANADRMAP